MTKEPFYDRHEEIRYFREKYIHLKKGELIVFYGRRRLGKTRLIKRFLDESSGKKIYSFVNFVEEKELMVSFANDILAMTGDSVKIDRWSILFDYLYEEAEKEKVIFVIDEFQRLKTLAPGFITELQNYWDSKLKNCTLMLVIVGSSIGMMRKIAVSASGVLYGRKTGEIQLRPFRYVDFREVFPSLSEEDKINWYAVFGGTPYYLELIHEIKNLKEAILKIVLEKNSPLREEAKNLLEFELRVIARYNSILQAIAQGKKIIKEISDETGIPAMSLPQYIDKFIKLLNLVEKKEPLLGKEKNSRYVLSDNFFKFWYLFVFPNQSSLEIGNTKYVLDKIDSELNGYVGRVFENIVREAFILYNGANIKDIALDFTNIGSWWDRTGREIDLVIENKNELILGEIKWTNNPMDGIVLEDLMRKTQFVNYRGRITYVLISKNGFSRSCQDLAAKTHTTLLDLKELESLFILATKKNVERRKIL